MSLKDNSTRSIQIVAGSSLTTFTSPNVFTYKLPASGYNSGLDEVSLKLLTMYFSWPNISSAKANNSYSYHWPGTSDAFPVVMPDGIWSFDDFNSYLQQVMKSNGHYLLDSNDDEVYYISLVVNGPLYCLSLVVTPLPASLPSGWSNPGGVTFTGALQYPQLIVSAGIATYTGFAAGTYPASQQTGAAFTMNSGIPQLTDVQVINVNCNLVDSGGFTLTPSLLTSFVVPSGTAAGAPVKVEPMSPDWAPVGRNQNYSEIAIRLTDQYGKALNIRDPTGFVATLSIRRRR